MAEVILYADARGAEPVRDFIQALVKRGRRSEAAAISRVIMLLGEHGWDLRRYGTGQTRLIDREERIYELRASAHRVAYAEHGGKLVLLHAWRKTTQRLSRKDLRLAQSRLGDWRRRSP